MLVMRQMHGLLVLMPVMCLFGCAPRDPMAAFIAKQDSLPPEERVPDWERTRRLILRTAPAVGDVAPDFELPLLDGSGEIRRSEFHEGRPLVLVFGSFT